MDAIQDILIVAIVFSAIYGVIKLLVQRKERLMMIERGSNLPELKKEGFTFSSLKFGMFFSGIGIGAFVAGILSVTTRIQPEVAYFSMIFLFGGLSLVIHHLIEIRKEKDTKEKTDTEF